MQVQISSADFTLEMDWSGPLPRVGEWLVINREDLFAAYLEVEQVTYDLHLDENSVLSHREVRIEVREHQALRR